jgi:hypothetical protein
MSGRIGRAIVLAGLIVAHASVHNRRERSTRRGLLDEPPASRDNSDSGDNVLSADRDRGTRQTDQGSTQSTKADEARVVTRAGERDGDPVQPR